MPTRVPVASCLKIQMSSSCTWVRSPKWPAA